ncbi:hypothetical protein ISE1_3758 [plant metagenome]|uniref:Uncharacterized protein n=1 Tax=plant metagenome TaxID=1297885 RepID=A0A484P6A3_9ZZZZ
MGRVRETAARACEQVGAHARLHRDPAHQWLHEHIVKSV